jgi:hypothetical protein
MPWKLANPFGILVNEAFDAWHTGRVRALLPVQGANSLLVGSDGGGVWQVFPTDEASKELSHDWEDPDVSTLIQTNDPSVVIAGTQHGSLYVSDVAGAGGGVIGNFRHVPLLDPSGAVRNPGWIWGGVVEPVKGRLVVACEAGLLWAEVPPKGGDYVFHDSVGPPNTRGPFSGVALGPSGRLIGAGKGPTLQGMFTARWVGSQAKAQLQVKPAASVRGVAIASMRRTSVVSVGGNPKFAFALSAQAVPNDIVFLVALRSKDGGLNWEACPISAAIATAIGNQADQNQAIAVAPNPAATSYADVKVAVGMRRGPFVSGDGGTTWFENGDDGSGLGKSPHLHGDIHVLLFDSGDPKTNTLYVGSDGGVARNQMFDSLTHMHNVSEGWETRPFNRRLPILEFSGSNGPGFRAGSSAGPGLDFLIGGGTQDNNTIWSIASAKPTPWRVVEKRGDGGYLTFAVTDSTAATTQGLGVATDADAGGEMLATIWDQANNALRAQGVIPIAGGNGGGLTAPAKRYASLSAVRKPQWPGRQQRIVAVCASGSGVYGYAEQGAQVGEWRSLANLNLAKDEVLTAIGSRRGDPIFAGTNTGRIFAITPNTDPTKASIQELGVKPPVVNNNPVVLGDVKMILDIADDLTIAIFNGFILRRRALQFAPVDGVGLPSGSQLRGIACDNSGRLLFAAFDSGVYLSTDDGDHWNPFSDGLPTTPHGAELYVGVGNGSEYLYLATWGRSVYAHQL